MIDGIVINLNSTRWRGRQLVDVAFHGKNLKLETAVIRKKLGCGDPCCDCDLLGRQKVSDELFYLSQPEHLDDKNS